MNETNPQFNDLSFIKEPLPSSEVKVDKKASLEMEKYEGSVRREEKMNEALHKVFICFTYTAFGIFLIVFVIRVLHFVIPEAWHWLTPEQIQGIDKLIFSGTIGGFIGRYFNRFNPKP